MQNKCNKFTRFKLDFKMLDCNSVATTTPQGNCSDLILCWLICLNHLWGVRAAKVYHCTTYCDSPRPHGRCFLISLICAPLSTLSSILLPVTQKSVSVLKDVSVPKMHLEDTRQREEEACWRSLYSRCYLCFLPSVFKASWSTAGIHKPNRRRTVWTKLHMYSFVIIMFKCAAIHYFLYLATF